MQRTTRRRLRRHLNQHTQVKSVPDIVPMCQSRKKKYVVDREKLLSKYSTVARGTVMHASTIRYSKIIYSWEDKKCSGARCERVCKPGRLAAAQWGVELREKGKKGERESERGGERNSFLSAAAVGPAAASMLSLPLLPQSPTPPSLRPLCV